MPHELEAVAKNIRDWLEEEYQCEKIDSGCLPPPKEQYIKPTGKCIYLASKDIYFKGEAPIALWHSHKLDEMSKLSDKIYESVKGFKLRVEKMLQQCDINKGDTLYVRDWPTVYEDDLARRDEKFAWYGWIEVFCEPIEIQISPTRG